jgi:methionyl-tRNA synthetase
MRSCVEIWINKEKTKVAAGYEALFDEFLSTDDMDESEILQIVVSDYENGIIINEDNFEEYYSQYEDDVIEFRDSRFDEWLCENWIHCIVSEYDITEI